VGTPEGNRCRWEDIIKTDIRDIGWGGIDWIDLAQDRDQWKADLNMVKNFLGDIKCCEMFE
jgi:hypothetical protein